MLGLLLDAAVLIGVTTLLNEGQVPGWGTAIFSALGISVIAIVAGAAHWALAVVAFSAAAFVVFWAVIHLIPKQAALGAGILLVYKLGMVFLFSWLMGK